ESSRHREQHETALGNTKSIPLCLDREDPESSGWIYFCGQDVVWGTTADRPIIRFRHWSEVELDPTMTSASLTPGTETEHGVLGAKPRYGHIVRTENFTIEKGRVFFLAKGRGRVYAAVDSHTLIAGPLHGRLIQEFDTRDKWQWVQFDLTPYKGHHC